MFSYSFRCTSKELWHAWQRVSSPNALRFLAFGHPTASYNKGYSSSHIRRWENVQQKSIKEGGPFHATIACCIPTCTWRLAGAAGSMCVQGMDFWSCCQGSRGVHWDTGERVRGHRLPEQLIQITALTLGQAGGSQGIGCRIEWMFFWILLSGYTQSTSVKLVTKTQSCKSKFSWNKGLLESKFSRIHVSPFKSKITAHRFSFKLKENLLKARIDYNLVEM